jgi:hypothetical protein
MAKRGEIRSVIGTMRIAMKSTHPKRIAAVLSLLLGMGVASLSHAQYVWLNDQGVKQFSDMPPPASVPKNRILKAPPGSPRPPATAADAPADDNAAAPAAKENKGPMTTAERNADFQKRKAEQAAKEKKEADEAQAAADKAKNCERARAYAKSLESGERVSKLDKNGEKAYLTDQQRAQEAQEAKRYLDACK